MVDLWHCTSTSAIQQRGAHQGHIFHQGLIPWLHCLSGTQYQISRCCRSHLPLWKLRRTASTRHKTLPSSYATTARHKRTSARKRIGCDQFRFDLQLCKEGKYNPVASLLLTTSEGAVKRLFSRQRKGMGEIIPSGSVPAARHDANEIHFRLRVCMCSLRRFC